MAYPLIYEKEYKSMANNSITASYNSLPWIVKLLIVIFVGWAWGGIYRILRYLETKNVVTLVVGIVTLVTGIGNGIIWVVDIITTILSGKITVLAD